MSGGLSGKDVEDILRLLDATQFDQIELEMDGLTLRATRGPIPLSLAGEVPRRGGGGPSQRARASPTANL